MASKKFLLEIVTPEKFFYRGEVEIVIARTLSGEEGFMAGHTWACKLLGTGELWFREADAKEYKLAAISGGFIDVRGDILIFADSAEWPDDIDVERANAAYAREQEWLEKHGLQDYGHEEIEARKAAVRRAVNRQKVASGGGVSRR